MNQICINCGAFSAARLEYCKICKQNYRSKENDKLIKFARDAATFGYVAREGCENQFRYFGAIIYRCEFCPTSEPYTYLALAALSGIVGGLAWDSVKIAARKLLLWAKGQKDQEDLTNFLKDQNELKRFSIYIENYYNGQITLTEDVKVSLETGKELDLNGMKEEFDIDEIKTIIAKPPAKRIEELMRFIRSEALVNLQNDRPSKETIQSIFKGQNLQN